MAQCVQCEVELSPSAQFCANCGAQVTIRGEPEADPYLGRVFAQKYRVEELLGEGGMGRVYRAVQLSLDKVVCLKVLRRELASDPQTQARFQREARAASRLNHPNSIQVMDFGAAEGGELYLAMEYIKGRDLQQILSAEFPLGDVRVCHIMAQVLDALAEAHAQHVIHRDLKPENIMVFENRGDVNYVKVLDFGIAKIQDTDTQPKLTRAGLVCGTPEYMSPEQARGLDLDARSDLYSAGVILYQMVTGALPFNADNPIGFVTAHISEPPVPPRSRGVVVTPALESLILRTLSKNREERPPSAKAMWSELLGIERGSDPEPTTHTGPVSFDVKAILAASSPTDLVRSQSKPPPKAKRRPLGLMIGVGAAIVVLAGGAIAARQWLPSHAEPADAPGSPTAPPATSELVRESLAAYQDGVGLYRNGLAEADDAKRQSLMQQAIKKLTHAYTLAPDDPRPLRWIGGCQQALGNDNAAKETYKKYLATVPEPIDAPAVRATLKMLDSSEK